MPSSDRLIAKGTNGYDVHVAEVGAAVHVRMRSQKNGKSHCLVELTGLAAIVAGKKLIEIGEAAFEMED